MKILQINSVCGTGSTGRITSDLYEVIKKEGNECKVAFGRGKPRNVPKEDRMKIGNKFGIFIHVILSRITDKSGFYSKIATKLFLRKVKKYNPDIIHLHNIHGYYINIPMLFKYIKKENKKVVWTLHDCWSFTGHCSYFDYLKCDRWKEICEKCPARNEYPKSIFVDNSKNNYFAKKEIFNNVEDLTIVTPSKWLKDLVEKSYLKKYEVKVINNGIDLEIFKHTSSNFKENYDITNKKVILGLTSIWEKRKGLEDFKKLAKKIPEEYVIVLVGLTSEQIKEITSENIIGIEKTNNLKELIEIYSSADVFLNLTYEDNFPTTNLEALACGIPIITYNTGGSIEAVDDKVGTIVEKGNLEKVLEEIINITQNSTKDKLDCIEKSNEYDKNNKFKEYIQLYNISQKEKVQAENKVIYLSCASEENYIKEILGKNPEIFAYQAQKYNNLLIKGFSSNKKNKVETISMLPINRQNYEKIYLKKYVISINNLTYNHISRTNTPILKNIFTIIEVFLDIMKTKKNKKNVIVGDALNISLVFGALLAAKIRKIKIVGIITDIPQFSYKKPIIAKINNKIIDMFDSYVFLTKDMNGIVNKKDKPFVVIEGQVDNEMVNIENIVENKYNKKICIYAGSLKKIYGIEYLVKGFINANIENSELWIYGNGDYKEELINICNKNKYIKYLGTKSNETIVNEEIKATLLINPRPTNEEYTKYSFPSKNMEYMVSGTPVLTTNLPGMPEEYKEYVYLIEKEDENGIEENLKNILNKDKKELNEFGLKAKKFVLENKNNNIQADKIMKMVEKNDNN